MKADRLSGHKQDANICGVCGKCFENETVLMSHELTAHPNVRSPHSETKPRSKKDNAAEPRR